MKAICVICGRGYEKLRNAKTCSDECSDELDKTMLDLAVRITRPQADRISRHANRTGQSASDVVRRSIDEYLAKEERQGGVSGNPRVIRTQSKS